MPALDLAAVRRVRLLHEEFPEISVLQLSRKAGVSWMSAERYIGDSRYDPYLDEVALARAMDGERAVYERLTVFEMAEFRRRVAQLSTEDLNELATRLGFQKQRLVQIRHRGSASAAA